MFLGSDNNDSFSVEDNTNLASPLIEKNINEIPVVMHLVSKDASGKLQIV